VILQLPHRPWLTGCLLLFACGCGNSTTLKTYPASGTVTLPAGQPMKGGTIQFTAAEDSLVRISADISDDGSFVLHTLAENHRQVGAPEGEYEVTIQPPLVVDPRGGPEGAHRGVPAIVLSEKRKVEPRENTYRIELPTTPAP
jgi:hypothetical protein